MREEMDEYEQLDLLNNEAYTHFAAGEYAKAKELYEASFDAQPNPGALRGIGLCFRGMGQNHEAIIYIAASAGLRPNPKASFDLAETLLLEGHLDEAKRATERAIALLPHYASARTLLSKIEEMIAATRYWNGEDAPQASD